VLLAGLFMFRFQRPAYQEGPALVGWVEPDSPAAAAGIESGDRIVRLDGHQEPQWSDIEIQVAAGVNQPLEVEIERQGQHLVRTITPRPEGRSELGTVGWTPILPAKVQAVDPDLPAAAAGIAAGDEILSINGMPVLFWPRISETVQQNEGQPLEVAYRSGCARDAGIALDATAAGSCGEIKTAQITPVLQTAQGEAEKRWLIGVNFQYEMITRKLGPVAALSESLATNKRFALLIFQFVGKIFSRELSPRTLEGPIGIARLSGAAARQSLGDLVSLMAAISLNLGIFNLFPIPVLDGGLILLLLIEGVMRRDLSRPMKERITQVGFAFLMLIFVFVIYNDIVKSLPERFGNLFP
jgi:regulator of sigma E protease